MVVKKTTKKGRLTGHRFFDLVRADEAKSDFPFYRNVEKYLISFEGALAELGVSEGVLLDFAYQRKIFFIFHRPVGVDVRRVARVIQRYDTEAQVEQPMFLVHPSSACFDLHFQDQVDLWEVEMAMSFSYTRGLSGLKLQAEHPVKSDPLSPDLFMSLNAREEEWKKAWGCWGFLRNGTRSSVRISKKDLFLPREELQLARSLLWEARDGDTTSLHSRQLQVMIDASYKFWIESGAADKSAPEPTNADVEAWFQLHGLKQVPAKTAASIIRPATATRGGPKPKAPRVAKKTG